MRRCKGCNRPLPTDSAPQRRYCEPRENRDCKTERDAYRKAHERARAYNALTRVQHALPERPKRKTSARRDEKGELDYQGPHAPTSLWDEIDLAWQRANVRRVDALMSEAERGVRRVDRSAGMPVGQFRDVERISEWNDGQKEYSIVCTARSCPGCVGVPEDAGDAAELWLRGDTDKALANAEKAQAQVLQRLLRENRA